MNTLVIILILAALAAIAYAVRRARRQNRWAPIPTLTDLNGPRLTKRMGRARRAMERHARHEKLVPFLSLEGVKRRP